MGNNKKYYVYIHTSPSGKRYVGITSQKLEARWRKNGTGYFYQNNDHLEKAIKKYGWENFSHEIIAENLTEEEAKQIEKDLIKKYNTHDSNYGYNKTDGDDGFCGVQCFGEENSFYSKHHTDETKKTMQEALGNPVCQLDFNLNIINIYPNMKEAARSLGLKETQIGSCISRKVGFKTAGGFLWVLKKDINNIELLNSLKQWLQHEKLPKPVYQYDLEMNYVNEYPSIGEASRATGTIPNNISLYCSKKNKTAGGYIWILKEDVENASSFEEIKKFYINNSKSNSLKEVCQFSLDGKYIKTYNSLTSAGKAMKVTRNAIGSACRSVSHKSCDYIWKYKQDCKESELC